MFWSQVARYTGWCGVTAPLKARSGGGTPLCICPIRWQLSIKEISDAKTTLPRKRRRRRAA